MNLSDLWTEKYRPSSLDDLVLNQTSKDVLNSFKESKTIPHLLFVSSPGTGKTSTAKILVKNVLQCDYLYLNASDENGIDTIRSKVITFAKTKSFDGNLKTIILDESDALSNSAQDALRNIIEEYADNVRFILTANYKHKISDAIQSRCQTICFDSPYKDVYARCINILINENVKVDKNEIPLIKKLIKQYYPDFRKCINELQKFSVSGKLKITNISISREFIEQIFSKLKDDVFELRQFIISSESEFQSDYHELLVGLLNFISSIPEIPILTKKDICICIADHMHRHASVKDTEINTFNCLLKISKLVG